jgi:hypothetical protein
VAGSPDEAVATPAPPAARTRAVDARVPALEDGARTSGATPRASAEAVLRGGPPPVAAAAVPSRASTVAATAAPPSAGGAHTAAAATALLRTFVDAVRVELQRTLGASRLPSAPPPLVADAHGATLGPALLRWVTSAVAERGVPLAPLQEAVRSAHARVEASLAGSVASTPSGALDGLQDTLRSVRDHVLRGLGASVERSEAGVRPEPSSMRGDVRVDAPVADPRGIPLAGSALVPRDDRVEAVESRVPARHGESELALGDEPPGDTGATRDEGDLQGPMDCVRRYFEAFLAGDSHAYAQQWVYPACVWKDGRWSAYPTAAACARGNDDYTFAVRAQGAVGGRIVMLRAEPVTPDVAIVHGVFTRERADGRVLQEVEAAYTTVRTAEGWRVAVCIVK